MPIEKMRIPGLIIGQPIKQGAFDKPASQIDLLPTVLPLLGIELSHPLIGHDLLSVPDNFQGRAILQFGDNNAYMLGDKVVVTLPHNTQRQFRFRNNQLIPEPLDTELAKDALAHAFLPSLLYIYPNDFGLRNLKGRKYSLSAAGGGG